MPTQPWTSHYTRLPGDRVISYSHIYDLAGAAMPGASVRPPTKERGPSMPSRGA